MLVYKVVLEPDDNNTLLVTCPDLPGVVTFGETREAALFHAVGAIEEMIAALIADGEPVPPPSSTERLGPNEAMVMVSMPPNYSRGRWARAHRPGILYFANPPPAFVGYWPL
jgi:predicted RNase H-like HicB family nuclease